MANNLTTKECAALSHWSIFGVHPSASSNPNLDPSSKPKRTTRADRKNVHPMLQPRTSSWDQVIPASEIRKLLHGYLPTEMEEKWFVYTEGPDEDGEGEFVVHMIRSWTGNLLASVRLLVPMGAGVREGEGDGDGENPFDDPPSEHERREGSCEEGREGKFTEIVWEASGERYRDQTEEGAKEMARGVCEWCLGVKFP